MALDAALLHCAAGPALRFYRWDPPAISLGHFQRKPEDIAALRATGLPLVRRMTGGGAIVHWHELTYSLLLPLQHPLVAGRDLAASYAAIHAPFQRVLTQLGLHALQRGALNHANASPLLCFDRATDLDLVCNGKKLMGSAQRRTLTHVLQHGSLILRTNIHQPDTAALEELTSQSVDVQLLWATCASAFAVELGPLEPADFTPEELQHAAAVQPLLRVS